MFEGFVPQQLDAEHRLYCGHLPTSLLPTEAEFDALWRQHPAQYHEILMHGRPVKTPRWQQAYGRDYRYTNRTNLALPVPKSLQPLLDWARRAIDSRLNGILLNWYDGTFGHYIGKHRDSIADMVEGAPIVTISLGQRRTFRLRPWKAEGFTDFAAEDGTVFVMPYETNLAWTHEVPHGPKYCGRRISVTLRAFH
jgi:alkylated DNA repair dioxygenase AlkB